MKIIIEGADGVGKSTIVRFLADRFNLDKVHFTNSDPRDLDFYSNTLRKNNVIFDRHFLSELIYPKYYNRPPQLLPYESEYLFDYAKNENVLIIILTADEFKFHSEEEPSIMENIEEINNYYLRLAGKYNLPTVNVSSGNAIEEIGALINEKYTS